MRSFKKYEVGAYVKALGEIDFSDYENFNNVKAILKNGLIVRFQKKLITRDKSFNKNKKFRLHIDKEISKTVDMMYKISLWKSRKHFLKTNSQGVSVRLKTYGKF